MSSLSKYLSKSLPKLSASVLNSALADVTDFLLETLLSINFIYQIIAFGS